MSPLRPVLIGLTAVLLAGVSLGFALSLFPDLPEGGRHVLLGWFGVIFFTIGACAVFSHAFGKDQPRLVLTPEGFHFNTVSQFPIPWRAVKGIFNWRQKRGRIIVVRVTDETWETVGMTTDALGARAANKLAGIDGVAISPSGMRVSFHELIRTFQAYAEAHGGLKAE